MVAPSSEMNEILPAALRRTLDAILILTCVFLIAPLVVVLATSLTANDYIIFPPGALSLRWYEELFSDRAFTQALWVSVQVATVSAFVATILGTAAAVGVSRFRFPGRGAVQAVLFSPIVLPGLVIGVAMLQFLATIQIRPSLLTILLGHALITIPYAMRLSAASLLNFDRKIEFAAMDLGATPIGAFVRVTLPNIAPGIAGGAMFAFIMSFEDVNVALFLSSPETTTLPVQIFNLVTQEASPVASAAGSVLAITIFLLAMLVERILGLEAIMQRK